MKTKRPQNAPWGFDLKTLDTSIRPQDDFFMYANGGWIKKTKLPKDESRWGSFIILRHNTDTQLHTIVKELTGKRTVQNASEKLVRDIYLSATNTELRNSLGVTPVFAWQTKIKNITNKDDLLKYIAEAHRSGISAIFNTFVDQDSKKSDRYILHLYQGGLGMPERDYYLKDNPEQLRVREAYKKHIDALLKLYGMDASKRKEQLEVVMRVETLLAKASMSKEDTRDVEKTYNKHGAHSLTKLCPAFMWQSYFTKLGVKNSSQYIVATELFFKQLSTLLERISLSDWKIYLEWHLLNDSASLLSEPFIKENFSFYGTVLTGTKHMKPLWRRALGVVNGTVGEALGELYVKRYFPESAKRKMNILVTDLFEVYEKRILRLDWMTKATKRKAVLKLKKMNRKIGYPEKFKTYKGLQISPRDYFGNMIRANEYAHVREMKKLQKVVQRKEWFMTPQTVNAYCSFNLNEIVFPAAILQAPFFDERADDSVNYAGIGAVIGHEMTHGFDDQGAKFDGNGNMKVWWTKTDSKHFEKKARVMQKQYDSFIAAPGVNVNGKLTLGENIADLGGLSIAYEAYQKRLTKTGRKDIEGFSPEERFFLGFAQAEREIARPEFTKMAALTDPHSPAPCRVNGPLSNFDPFYKTFKLKSSDALFRKNRVTIW